ncbi:hypothetical protein OBBRIDRAFT_731097 [Obba rivulosa]|uniref:Oxidase ustYa n=1 Tax=Obba rivulosa TaxID=1052685 RepID=A0A8E2ASP1_9APHY|nr:hypothetical protein OBBRIDRAFT_731097 [Obba rivulosa]
MHRALTVRDAVLVVLGSAFVLTSLLSVIVGQYHARRAAVRPREHTFEGDDYPAYYPHELGTVQLTPENTIHYQIYYSSAEREWESIFPAGGGFVRLGPDQRPFGFTLFHQLHCLSRIREAVNARKPTQHVHHCLNYLRQTILCDANPTLEPIIPILNELDVNSEVPRVCMDWTEVYRLAEENHAQQTGGVGGTNASTYL